MCASVQRGRLREDGRRRLLRYHSGGTEVAFSAHTHTPGRRSVYRLSSRRRLLGCSDGCFADYGLSRIVARWLVRPNYGTIVLCFRVVDEPFAKLGSEGRRVIRGTRSGMPAGEVAKPSSQLREPGLTPRVTRGSPHRMEKAAVRGDGKGEALLREPQGGVVPCLTLCFR
jgi:hypothetical protein